MYTQLESFLVKNNLLYELQSGFRSRYSTDTCLIHLIDHIKAQTAKGLFTGMVLLDLQKAFDTVDHEILCEKLSTVGVESFSWFKSYLTSRQQIVNINGVDSELFNVTCGVPQGNLLGSLLFLVYVNDMQISIDPDCKVLLYADDSAILFSHKDPRVISDKLSTVMESCQDWLVDNKLSLHLGKTESIIFGPKRKLQQAEELFCVKCNNHTIGVQRCIKYLGIFIDNLLSGEDIVNCIVKKVNQRLKFLYRNSSCLSLSTRQTLCSALIQCHLDYACASWYEGLTKCLKKKLQVAQNKMIRFILNLHNRHSVSYVEFQKLNSLNVPNRVKQLRLNHMYNIFHGIAPQYMQHNFNKSYSIHNTRSGQSNFVVPFSKGAETSFFKCEAVKDWNALPEDIKCVKSKYLFKRKVKHHLLEKMKMGHDDDFIFY